MSNLDQPFVLFVSKRFVDLAKKSFGLGFVVRKPLVRMLQSMGVGFAEVDRNEAMRRLDEVASSRNVVVSVGDVIKNVILSLLTPTVLLMAAKKKVVFVSAADTGDCLFMEFFCEIPRAFRSSLIYYTWLVIPKNSDGGVRTRQMLRAVVGKVGAEPITKEEWGLAEPIRSMFAGVAGSEENLWQSL